MAPIKVTTPEGEEKVLGPDDTSPHRFADLGGEVVSPGDPPTRAEAQNRLWKHYFNAEPDDKVWPTPELVDAELARMMDLYNQGAFERA